MEEADHSNTEPLQKHQNISGDNQTVIKEESSVKDGTCASDNLSTSQFCDEIKINKILPDVSEITSNNIRIKVEDTYALVDIEDVDLFKKIWKKEVVVPLPNNAWALHYVRKEEKNVVLLSECSLDSQYMPIRLRQLIIHEDMSLNYFIGNATIDGKTLDELNLSTHAKSLQDLINHINNFNLYKLCKSGPKIKQYSPGTINTICAFKNETFQVWCHNKCPRIVKSDGCIYCVSLHDNFKTQLEHISNLVPPFNSSEDPITFFKNELQSKQKQITR